MCVANLNVSTQPCNHRWYTLVRPCSPHTNLSNCPQKLKLEGWESRQESCPWCDDNSETENLDDSTHRLFGNRSDILGQTPADWRHSRRASSATNSTTSLSHPSLSRTSSRSLDCEDEDFVSGGASRGEKARLMNWRLDVYLMSNPDRKFRTSTSTAASITDEDVSPTSAVTAMSSDTEARAGNIRRSGSMIGRKMRKSMRLSRTIFKG